MRFLRRAGYVLILSALMVQAAAAKAAAGAGDSSNGASNSPDASAPVAAAPGATTGTPAAAATPDTSKKDSEKKGDSSDLAPMPATSGTIGLFTLSTGETLPKNGFMVSGYLNRFGRMPGGLVITESGINVAYGATDWLTIFANFIPGEHVHVNDPGEITPIQTNGFASYAQPFYVEDYPYASVTGHGTGPVTLGAEFGLVSERRGAPLSVAVTTDFLIPTRQQFTALAADGTQSGEVNWDFDINVSKDFGQEFVLTADSGVRMVRDPVYQGRAIMAQARQWDSGIGMILFPTRRIEFMNEYNFEVFFGHSTPDDTLGPRDPVDAIWGLRMYPTKWLAIDAGYRYMLNLYGEQDRNGFVFKVAASHVPHKAAPVNHPPTASCSADKSSVFVDSGDTVAVTSQASDPDGDTLTYNWTATGGKVDGTWAGDSLAFGRDCGGHLHHHLESGRRARRHSRLRRRCNRGSETDSPAHAELLCGSQLGVRWRARARYLRREQSGRRDAELHVAHQRRPDHRYRPRSRSRYDGRGARNVHRNGQGGRRRAKSCGLFGKRRSQGRSPAASGEQVE